jgi:FkbM family methyltransferase
MMTIKTLVKRIMAHTPYTVRRRTQLNRFQAIQEALESLARRGFSPRHIVDGGANVGHFAKEAMALFPDAVIYAIEPQPGCAEPLQALAARYPRRIAVHHVALSDPEGDGSTLTIVASETSQSTGAHVLAENETSAQTISVRSASLDMLTRDARAKGDGRWFIKLDLQGYELNALKGARETLAMADVVLSEVSFYAHADEPPIAEIVAFLAAEGFDLYDIASVFGRPRDNRPRQGDFIFVRRTCALAADNAWS